MNKIGKSFKKQSNKKLKVEHLQCSNLLHLSAVVQALQESSSPCHVLKTYETSEGKKVIVDIIDQDGFQWTKVIARSPQALERLSVGDQAYGQRSLTDQAKDYLQAAENNLHHFKPPNLVFIFHAGVPEKALAKLTALNIQVQGDIVPTFMTENSDSEDEDSEDESPISNYEHVDYSVLNLDITAMIAYVSAMTNGYANYVFPEKVFTQQASWERQTPVKPILEELFKGKKLITCQSAMDDFKTILFTMGGDGEKARAEELFERIEVVPDQISDKVKALKTGGKVRERSKCIFGTGDALQVLTVSANSGFIRAAQSQHIHLAVISHESRALTEGKMSTSSLIP